ncbi:MAG TPA: T9SS type A sorting domain-containing protein [Panacibacter sp.]|nr:T9SS type A sorting domain-containing protein [Panacibacter sp.]
MKKILCLLICFCTWQILNAQCPAHFLGDKEVMPCSNPFTIDWNVLFITDATFDSTVELTPTDTLKGDFGQDTIIYYTSKFKVFATSREGCKDSAIVRILVRIDPIPNLGSDTSIVINPGQTVDLTSLYYTTFLNPQWNTDNPTAAEAGDYQLIVTTRDGCKDTANIKIISCEKPSLGPDVMIGICKGETVNLTYLFSTLGLKTNWNTTNPIAAEEGIYTLVATNSDGCSDTANVVVSNNPKPELGNDKIIFICASETINLEDLFTLTDLTAVWNTPTPTAVSAGYYSLNATNSSGCTDIAYVTVTNLVKPSFLNDTIVKVCNGRTKDLTTVFPLEDFSSSDWGASDPTSAEPGIYYLRATDVHGCEYIVSVTVEAISASIETLEPCKYNKENTPAFSTNAFRSIVVDKSGNIWAGADGVGNNIGGLYKFIPTGDACGGAWYQVYDFRGITFQDLHLSNLENDNTIWAASTGYNAVNATGGGVYHIKNLLDVDHFSSIGDNTGGSLSSRFANSLAMSNEKLYVALGRSADRVTGEPEEGGVYEYDMIVAPPPPGGFTPTSVNLPSEGIRVSAAGTRNNEVWFGVEKSCDFNGVCTSPYIVKWNAATDGPAGFVDETNSPIPFNSSFPPIVRAIFTSSKGRTFVGLSKFEIEQEGIGVLEPTMEGADPLWTVITSNNSPLPSGAAVNYNAIEEVNGEIWIGTNKGVLVYDGIGSLNDCSSYKLYTKANNLPSDNVTDIAFDTAKLELWLTTDAGICRFAKESSITGYVVDISCGKPEELFALQLKTPLAGVNITLYYLGGSEDGNIAESFITSSTGRFELKKAKKNQNYRLEVNYLGLYIYRYDNIKYNSIVGEIQIPYTLVQDISLFIPELIEECAPPSVAGFKFSSNIFCTSAFDMTNYQEAFAAYNDVVEDLYAERVNNLLAYYLVLQSAEKSGYFKAKLNVEEVVAILDGFESLAKVFKLSKGYLEKIKIKKTTGSRSLTSLEKNLVKALELIVEMSATQLRSAYIGAYNRGDIKSGDELKKLESFFYSAGKMLVKIFENGLKSGVFVGLENELFDAGKKLMGTAWFKFSMDRFAEGPFGTDLKNSAEACKDVKSKAIYSDLFERIKFDMENHNSLIEQMESKTSSTLGTMQNLRKWAKIADMTQKVAETAELLLTLVPQWQKAATAVSVLAKIAQPALYFSSWYVGLSAENEVEEIAMKTYPTSQLTLKLKTNSSTIPTLIGGAIDEGSILNDAKESFNKSLTNFKTAIHSGDSTLFYERLGDLLSTDSTFSKLLLTANNSILPFSINAGKYIIGFDSLYNDFLGNYSKKIMHEFAINNLVSTYEIDENKSDYFSLFDSLINELQIFNDSTILLLELLQQSIVLNSVPSSPFILLDSTIYNFDYHPGSPGSATFFFKNYGSLPIVNYSTKVVSDSIFTFTSVDSIFVGTILPGETKTVSYSFIAPITDTTVTFNVIVNADSGYYNDVVGFIITQTDTMVLPLYLNSFSASKVNDVVELHWSSSSEQMLSKYTVEHSKNASVFTAIGTVEAKGNSSTLTNYSFTHLYPSKGRNYYRLKMIDKDGKFRYSKIVVVDFGIKAEIVVFPNPAKGNFTISGLSSDQTSEIQLIDIQGKILLKQVVNANSLVMDISKYAAGIYFINVITGEKRQVLKIINQP